MVPSHLDGMWCHILCSACIWLCVWRRFVGVRRMSRISMGSVYKLCCLPPSLNLAAAFMYLYSYLCLYLYCSTWRRISLGSTGGAVGSCLNVGTSLPLSPSISLLTSVDFRIWLFFFCIYLFTRYFSICVYVLLFLWLKQCLCADKRPTLYHLVLAWEKGLSW